MSKANTAQEPSMDEILASIRRIIQSGDDRGGGRESGAAPRLEGRPPLRDPGLARDDAGSKAIARLVADVEGGALRSNPHPAIFATAADNAIEEDPAGDADVFDAELIEAQWDTSSAAGLVEADWSVAAGSYADLTRQLEEELAADDGEDWNLRTFDAGDPRFPEPDARLPAVAADEGGRRSLPEGDLVSVGDVPARAVDTKPQPAGIAPTDAERPLPEQFSTPKPGSPAVAETPRTSPDQAEPDALATARSPFMAASNDFGARPTTGKASIGDARDGRGEPSYSPLVSEQAGDLISASFDELTRALRSGELRSMEEMAQEMLRPMLQEWLDDNLPKLVERLVREEIERVARGARR